MIKIPKGSSFADISHRLQKLIPILIWVLHIISTTSINSRISKSMKWNSYSNNQMIEYKTKRVSWFSRIHTHFLNYNEKQQKLFRLVRSSSQIGSVSVSVELRNFRVADLKKWKTKKTLQVWRTKNKNHSNLRQTDAFTVVPFSHFVTVSKTYKKSFSI